MQGPGSVPHRSAGLLMLRFPFLLLLLLLQLDLATGLIQGSPFGVLADDVAASRDALSKVRAVAGSSRCRAQGSRGRERAEAAVGSRRALPMQAAVLRGQG